MFPNRISALLLVFAAGFASHTCAEEPKSPYDPTKIWPVHIRLAAEEYAAMQPRGGGFFGAKKPPEKIAADPKEPPREIHRNTFGVDLAWAVGSITVGDDTLDNVGIRYKGNGTIADATNTARKSFKIDLNRHGGTGVFLGAKGINLHSGVADPTRTRETLGYALYRAAGVPAPRTTLAEVRLTVPGKFDRELLGVYTIVEPVDKTFLRNHFGTDAGLLMKPEPVPFSSLTRDLTYKGDDWTTYEKPFAPKRPATAAEAKRMIAFFRLIHKATDAEFQKEINDFLDLDGYLRFLAMTALEANIDSFFGLGHNYYAYLHPKTGRVHFFPWDVDRSFANLPFFGTFNQHMDVNVLHPYPGTHRLTDRLLAMPEVNEKYIGLVKEFTATCFAKDRLIKEAEGMDGVVKELIAAESKSATARKEGGLAFFFAPPRPPTIQVFAEKRTVSIAAQIAGDSKGYTPGSLFFPIAPKAGNDKR